MLAFRFCKWQFMRNNKGRGWWEGRERWREVGATVSGAGSQPFGSELITAQIKRFCGRSTPLSLKSLPRSPYRQNFYFRHVIYLPPKHTITHHHHNHQPPSTPSLPHLKMTGSKTSHGRCKLGQQQTETERRKRGAGSSLLQF